VTKLLSKGTHGLQLVFVSACHSEKIGRRFLQMGVPFVICCKEKAELNDNLAQKFTKQFYTLLLRGKAVDEAYRDARRAVFVDKDGTGKATKEANKYILLGPTNVDRGDFRAMTIEGMELFFHIYRRESLNTIEIKLNFIM